MSSPDGSGRGPSVHGGDENDPSSETRPLHQAASEKEEDKLSDNDDRVSILAGSDTATSELLSSPPSSTHSVEPQRERLLGLQRAFGWSSYDDYDVITVHGIRDDRNTAWTTRAGTPWLRDQLFEGLSIRQLDYSYRIDSPAAVFQHDGIRGEAQNLLYHYSRERCGLPDTEIDRPIVWVCHDIGGSIVKQALIEAAQSAPAKRDNDNETYNNILGVYRKIATRSTAIVFLGCPHRTESVDELEDQLYGLLSSPGPDISRGIMVKIKRLATQIDRVNIEFLQTKMLSRGVILNVFYLPDIEELHTYIEVERNRDEGKFTTPLTTSSTVPGSPIEASPEQSKDASSVSEILAPVSSPFSRYTLTMFNPFEFGGRYRQMEINHADLVRGDEGIDHDESWITYFAKEFNKADMPIQISHTFIQNQRSILALTPPTRVPKVHQRPARDDKLPFLAWLHDHSAFKTFKDGVGPRVLYVHGGKNHTSKMPQLSQYLYTDYESGNRDDERVDFQKCTFYFEFDKRDSRYKTITSMLVSFLNELVWRFWQDNGTKLAPAFEYLDNNHCWSLQDLFHLFNQLRECQCSTRLTLFLSCFDQCDEREREWFIQKILKRQNHCDTTFRIIITSGGPDSILGRSLPESCILSLDTCPVAVKGYKIDDKEQDAGGLSEIAESLLCRRPVLARFRPLIEELTQQCLDTPHLGYILLNWLRDFKRGCPAAELNEIAKLSPVTPQNLLNFFIGYLKPATQRWAKQVCCWVRFAAEPLTVQALAHAVAVSIFPQEPLLDDIEDGHIVREIDRIFGGIVTIDGLDVKFSHDSFYDQTELGTSNQDELVDEAHAQIAEACLNYIMLDEVRGEFTSLSVENNGGDLHPSVVVSPRRNLLAYAVRFWPHHYRLGGTNKPTELAVRLFQHKFARNAWTEAHYVLSNPFTRIHRSYLSPLPYMASLGLEDLLLQQVEIEKPLWSFQNDCWLGIIEAARNGQKLAARILLGHAETDQSSLQDAIRWAAFRGDVGAIDDLIKKTESTANFEWPTFILARAVAAGLEPLVSALLKSGYDVNEKGADEPDPAIHTAISWGQKGIIELMLDFNVDLHSRDDSGNTPLLIAAEIGDPDIMQLLLDGKVNLEEKNENGLSALSRAVSYGQHKALELLVKAGADFKSGEFDPHDDDINFTFPVIKAADFGHTRCLRVLLENGSDPCAECKQGSALYLASNECDFVEICQLLLEKGANPNQYYPDKEMLLLRALGSASVDLVRILIKHGALVNSVDTNKDTEYKSPICFAVSECSTEMVALLLDSGASVNFEDEESEPPLFVAGHRTLDLEKAGLLIAKGANVNWKRSSDGWTTLHAAYDLPEFVTVLLTNGADINSMSKDGTVLMMAARWDYPDTIKILLGHTNPKPDLEIRMTSEEGSEEYDCTALELACNNGHRLCASLLLEAGAIMSDKLKNGTYALQYARRAGKDGEAMLNLLLKYGMRHEADDDGNTALHSIWRDTPISAVKLLVDSGAPVDVVNAKGYTPLAIAVDLDNVEVAKYLISKKARLNIYSPKFGSILHLACTSSTSLELVKLIIKGKDDHGLVDYDFGGSVLYAALERNRRDLRHNIVRCLIEDARVDVNARGGSLGYPIICAAQRADSSLLRYLIRHHADVNVADDLGRRAIHFCVRNASLGSRKSPISELATAGADLQVKDNYDRTPLHFAASFGSLSTLDCLLEHLPRGFDINAVDADGWTPLMWACRLNNNHSIVETMIERGADIWPKSKNGEWSALKLACYHGLPEDTKKLLEPPAHERICVQENGAEEKWDSSFHKSLPRQTHPDASCSSCLLDIVGIYWKCIVCEDDILLCFKCFGSRSTMHNSLHEFQEIDDTQASRRASRRGSETEPEVIDDVDLNEGKKDIGGKSTTEEPKSDTSSDEGAEEEEEEEEEEDDDEE